ncbi:KH domain-containing protein [candidate division WWE3 bacterium]|nr:KH domain-containing protein [candidate division WWE3 bacterium]
MKEFVQYLVQSIAKHPEDVEVVEKQLDETYIKEEISVHPDDMGLIIGRNGRTIRSVRELAKAKAIKANVKVDVELLEPDREEKGVKEAVEEAAEEVADTAEEVVDSVENEVNEMAEELMDMVEGDDEADSEEVEAA